MRCPSDDAVAQAISRCPFLHNIASSHGESFARQVATRPQVPANPAAPVRRAPLLEEDYADYSATLRLFHGPGGVVPLKKFEQLDAPPAGRCPFAASSREGRPLDASQPSSMSHATDAGNKQQLPEKGSCDPAAVSRRGSRTAAPFAAISLGGSFGPLPNPADVLRFLGKKPRKPSHRPSRGGNGGPVGGGGGSTSAPGDRVSNPHKPPNARLGQAAPTSTPISNPGAGGSTTTGAAAGGGGGGRCPMRRFIEPLGGLLPLGSAALARLQSMKCPRAIIAARAAVARTEAVRQLRPQTLPVKMLAIGALAAFVNVPFGAWREHNEKFSPGWFVAVHAPIPFIAIMRKAVLMPKWAMALTFTAAIVGQALGAQFERQRLAALADSSSTSLSAPGAAPSPPPSKASAAAKAASGTRGERKAERGIMNVPKEAAIEEALQQPVRWALMGSGGGRCAASVADMAARPLPLGATFLHGVLTATHMRIPEAAR